MLPISTQQLAILTDVEEERERPSHPPSQKHILLSPHVFSIWLLGCSSLEYITGRGKERREVDNAIKDWAENWKPVLFRGRMFIFARDPYKLVSRKGSTWADRIWHIVGTVYCLNKLDNEISKCWPRMKEWETEKFFHH